MDQSKQGCLFHRETATFLNYNLVEDSCVLIYSSDSTAARILLLSNCAFPTYPDYIEFESDEYPSFEIVHKNMTYAVICKDSEVVPYVRAQFIRSSEKSVPMRYQKCCLLCKGALVLPYRLTDKACNKLEFLGDRLHRTPDLVFKSQEVTQPERYVPGNIASGIFVGTKRMLSSIFKGIGGVFYEPIKGAKATGFKGATLGLGKGILGLFCRPVAGTLDLVSLTVRGMNNMPGSVYNKIVKVYRKRKSKKALEKEDELFFNSDRISESDHIVIEDPVHGEIEQIISESVDNEDLELVVSEQISLVRTEELLSIMLQRNQQYEVWIHQLSSALGTLTELPATESSPDDPVETRMLEAKERGQVLRLHLVQLTRAASGHLSFNENMDDAEFSKRIVEVLYDLGFQAENPQVLSFVQQLEEEMDEENTFSPMKTFFGDEPLHTPSILSATSREDPMISQWQPYDFDDDFRVPIAHSKGGIGLADKAVHEKLKQAGKEIIKMVGKKILRGDMNLTTVSFPIGCMMPATVMHNILTSMKAFPLYFALAAASKSPIERLKLVAVGCLATFKDTSTFLKPLNPILGETLSGSFEDGTVIYAEQTAHHPPTSHFHLIGPKKSYDMHGYCLYKATASFNSINITNLGGRTIRFHDGQVIKTGFPEEVLNNTFIGQMRHESVGRFTLTDTENKLQCIIRLGSVSKRPSDYLEGVIVREESKVLSKLKGTYLGYLDFDGVRYWDARAVDPFSLKLDAGLPSDSEIREDLALLRRGLIDQAQRAKEALENLQRHDAGLRKTNK